MCRGSGGLEHEPGRTVSATRWRTWFASVGPPGDPGGRHGRADRLRHLFVVDFMYPKRSCNRTGYLRSSAAFSLLMQCQPGSLKTPTNPEVIASRRRNRPARRRQAAGGAGDEFDTRGCSSSMSVVTAPSLLSDASLGRFSRTSWTSLDRTRARFYSPQLPGLSPKAGNYEGECNGSAWIEGRGSVLSRIGRYFRDRTAAGD
jgi:hypothetical protein